MFIVMVRSVVSRIIQGLCGHPESNPVWGRTVKYSSALQPGAFLSSSITCCCLLFDIIPGPWQFDLSGYLYIPAAACCCDLSLHFSQIILCKTNTTVAACRGYRGISSLIWWRATPTSRCLWNLKCVCVSTAPECISATVPVFDFTKFNTIYCVFQFQI